MMILMTFFVKKLILKSAFCIMTSDTKCGKIMQTENIYTQNAVIKPFN